jgi:hypothetical protein
MRACDHIFRRHRHFRGENPSNVYRNMPKYMRCFHPYLARILLLDDFHRDLGLRKTNLRELIVQRRTPISILVFGRVLPIIGHDRSVHISLGTFGLSACRFTLARAAPFSVVCSTFFNSRLLHLVMSSLAYLPHQRDVIVDWIQRRHGVFRLAPSSLSQFHSPRVRTKTLIFQRLFPRRLDRAVVRGGMFIYLEHNLEVLGVILRFLLIINNEEF